MATWTAYKTWSFISPNNSWAFDGIGNEGTTAAFDSSSTSTHYVFNNSDGTKTVLNGSGFTGRGDVSWTSLTSVQHLAADGSTIEQITNITATSAPAGHFFSGILAGADTFTGSSGADQFYGHEGNNVVFGGAGADVLRTSTGNDTFRIQAGDYVAGEVIDASGGFDIIQLENAGNIDLRVGTISNIEELYYYSGTSVVTADAGQFGISPAITTIVGSANIDRLILVGPNSIDYTGLTFSGWTPGQDTITYLVGTGNFGTLKTTAQNETFQLTGDGGGIQSGGGDDTFVFTGNAYHGGIGLDGGTGTNIIQLNNATLDYSGDQGTVFTNIQQIQYIAGDSSLTVSGKTLTGAMPQTLVGSAGVDTFKVNILAVSADLSGLTFNSWNDAVDKIIIDGHAQDGASAANIVGTIHPDTIIAYTNYGFNGQLSINGGGGNDTIYIGTGTETLTGGAGADRFVFANDAHFHPDIDIVTDFTVSGASHDVIDLKVLTNFHTFGDVMAASTQSGADTVINLGNGDTLTLQGVTKTSLTADDFAVTPLLHFDNAALKLSAFGANPAAGGWANTTVYPREVADVNGDGYADIVGFSGDGVQVSLGNSSGGFANPISSIHYYGSNASAGGWSTDNVYTRELADVNGDGKTDIVGFSGQGVFVSLATTGGQFSSPFLGIAQFGANADAGGWSNNNVYHREMADVNGDGKADIVGFGGAGVYVALATGDGHFANPILGIAAYGANAEAGGWANDNVYHREMADVNGDGSADIVGFGDSGVYVSLATGDGHFAGGISALSSFGAGASGGGWTTMDSYPRHLADVNGDGRADIVGFGGANVYVAQGNANGTFGAPTSDIAYFGNSASAGSWANDATYPRALADINGDHHADIVGFNGNGVYVALATHNFDLI